MERPSYLLEVPAEEYHAATKRNEFTTSHRLDLFRKCPALYKKTIDGEIVEGDTAAFALGRATHAFVLEGAERFNEEFAVSDGPMNEKTGKPYGRMTRAYADWLAEQPKPVVSAEDFGLIAKMREAVHAHTVAKDLLSAGFAEGTIRATWEGEPVQARLDWFDPERGILIDLKTCNDVDRFAYDVRDFGYAWQLAFYGGCLRIAGYDGPLSVYLVAVEKKEPFRVAVVEFYSITLNDANYSEPGAKFGPGNVLMLRELLACREIGVWPTRYEEVIKM